MPNEPSTTRFLSLIGRPTVITEERIVQALMPIVNHDEATLTAQCSGMPPLVISPFPGPIARAAVAALENIHCTTFAPTLNDLHDLGPTMKIRAVHLDESGIIFETWQDHLQRVEPTDFRLLVSKYAPPSAADLENPDSPEDSAIRHSPTAIHFRNMPKLSPRKQDAALDLHTKDGRVFQVDAKQFAFDILGSRKQESNHDNMVALQKELDALFPKTPLDTNFAKFNLPQGYKRLKLSRAALNNEQLDFAYYSRWLALAYQHVADINAAAAAEATAQTESESESESEPQPAPPPQQDS